MSGRLSILAARHVGRPLLMLPRSAEELAHRIREVDARAFSRPGRIEALMRRLSGSRHPDAMEDDEDGRPVPLQERLAYAPIWAGEPEHYGFAWTLKDGVALMQADTALLERGESFCGEVYHGYDTLLAAQREALADARVRGLFLRLSSPGGVVAGGLPALAGFMRQAREAAGGKPIWVYADMACSAAYWIAAQADRILAPNVGLVGSIGAVIVHESWSRRLEKEGVEITAIQFGAKKTDGAWWAKLSDQAREDWQAEIDQCGRNFVADVEAGRPSLSREDALATQAGVFMGEHDEAERSALALNLIDAIASEEEAFAELRDHVASPSLPRQGSQGAAATGVRGATPPKEKPMAGKAQTPPGRASALQAAKLALRKAQADVARLEAEETPSDEEMDEDEEDAPPAEAEGGEPPADEDEAEEQEDGKVDAKTAEAILALPEAKGRDALARKLAFKAGMTVADAKELLAAAPKASGLAAEMAGARRLGADGPAPKSGAERIDAKAIYGRRAQRGGKAKA